MKADKENILAKMLELVKQSPGIRPSELNRKLGIPHTAHYRNLLIKQGKLRKQKDGSAVRYFAN